MAVTIPSRAKLRFVRRGQRHKLIGWLQPAGNILEEGAQRALLTVGERCRPRVQGKLQDRPDRRCRYNFLPRGEVLTIVISPSSVQSANSIADSLSYHCRRIAIHWILDANCRVKGCVKLFQFSPLREWIVTLAWAAATAAIIPTASRATKRVYLFLHVDSMSVPPLKLQAASCRGCPKSTRTAR